MDVIETSEQLTSRITRLKKKGTTIGFVPTMGSLHLGHLSLIEEAHKKSDVVVVSIFVNPTQFNSSDDLKSYPRDLEKDIKLLETTDCELLFAPSVKEIYPEQDHRIFDFGQIDKVMEGRFRPGHFNGVAQVVSRLFQIVKPDKAFFGLKDFQQIAVIREMVKQLELGVDIAACPIVRESDGLAMSSRNLLLQPEKRKKAPIIARSLFESCIFAKNHSVEETRNFVIDAINGDKSFEVEYFDIVDGETLQPVKNWKESICIVGCIAVFAGEVRLIDNVIYKNSES